ncbi:c-type cytochrome biogenesis protein CcmI [Methylomonas koyamae]|uniref:C-type cytochrome biogenesis protein CcmI n=1 Tax=Methylomonas koyamae TaxID=702114 RepID=A0A291IJC8_9GAMM|nr:c-type cytochrome biogenesis protein CcmI [Methylomonas koyamae]ATG90379.1 cytochrome C biogenesis protein CcmI [Methylomonas koyamae]OAI26693.1 c-type cytochrome biogenesis protein CcmI [Methylomonas koyamae]
MTIEFWLAIAGLLAVALAILLPPLFKTAPLHDADGEQRNKAIARQQLAELKQQLQDGILSQSQFDAQYQELQLALLDEIQQDAPTQAPARSASGRWAIPLVGVALPLLSLYLYLTLGEPEAIAKAELAQNQAKAADNVQNMVAALAQRLQQQPEDLEGWMMLGRAYLYMQQYDNSAQAFAELNRRKPNDPAVMLHYADALSMARNGQMLGEPAELVDQALKLVPEDHTALWLGGMAKAEAGDYAQAIAYWQKLAAMLPEQDETKQQLQKMIAMAEAEQGAGAVSAAAAPVEIKVDAGLAAELKSKADPADTLFVYAQAVTGPKMPLAIVKKQVKDLPLHTVLNDSMAMQPQTHLADFKQLRIVARISKSGNAMPQPGDLIGTAEVNLDGSQSAAVNLTIDRELK